MLDLINLDYLYYWFILGVIVLIVEIFTLSIVLLLTSFSLITVGGFLFFDFISDDNKIIQLVLFCSAILFWLAILWVPLNKIKKLQITKGYKNIIGQKAEVIDSLIIGKVGKVKWSGVLMMATLSKDSIKKEIPQKEYVTIVSIEGNILTVTSDTISNL